MAYKNRFFHSITGHLLPAFLIVAIIPTIMLTFTTFYSVKKVALNNTSQRTSEQFSLISGFLDDMVISTAMELSVIKGHNSFQNFLKNGEDLNIVKADFEGTMVRHSEFLQLRYLDKNGMEILRLNRDGDKLSWVKPEDLQDKSNYYYVKQVMRVSPNDIYVSDLDLNVEHNKVERPWRLVTRIGIKVFHEQKLRGILLVNMDGNYILSKILPFAGNRSDKAFLMNSQGKYIGYDGENFMVNSPEILNSKLGITNETIFNAEPKSLIKTLKGYLSVMPVFFYMQDGGNVWRVVLSVTDEEIYGTLTDAMKMFLTTLVSILGLAAILALTVSSKIIRIVKNIVKFIPDAANKPFKVTGIKEFDEIGVEIHSMAVGLHNTSTELEHLNNNLEERINSNVKQIADMAEKQMQYEKQLRDVQTQLMHADRLASLGLISATVAHEIGNPLAAMKASLQLLKMDAHDDEEREFISKIISQVDKLSEFLRNITKFGGRKKAIRKYVDIHSMLYEVNDFLRAEMKKNNIKLNIITNDAYKLHCDETEIRQILFNIMINSIHELENGGEIYVNVFIENDIPQLHIYDSGGGVEDIKKLFNPFYTTKNEGTGIGLAIVEDLIKENDWEMQAENVKGFGLGIRIMFR